MKQDPPKQKFKILQKNLTKFPRLAIAFSGGIDSTLLAHGAKQAGISIILITVTSPLFSHYDEQMAKQIAQQMKLPHILVKQSLEKDVIKNTTMRCFHCKLGEASVWIKEAHNRGYPIIADGANFDDITDPHRPGIQACTQLKIKHPLADAYITKEDIRTIAHQQNIPTWNQPANACLASRIQYGEKITTAKLHKIEQAEEFLRTYSPTIRVRLHQNIARIEVPIECQSTILTNKKIIIKKMKNIGFIYITLDLDGYRSGSMHEGNQK
jgi:uncharacterized protein